jgi:hypothetical protein
MKINIWLNIISQVHGILIIVRVRLIKIQAIFLDHPILIRCVDVQIYDPTIL